MSATLPTACTRPVYTAHQGDNSTLIAEVARLYLKPGMSVADVTYGRGVFWKQVDLSVIDFHPTDLKDGVDFRELPYADQSMDLVVLDPPYMHHPGKPQVDGRYNNTATTRGMGHDGIGSSMSMG
jgi:hypothetical protein